MDPKQELLRKPIEWYGTRYLYYVGALGLQNNTVYSLGRGNLPNHSIIHQICFYMAADGNAITQMKFALGDQTPASAAEFDALENLFPHMGFLIGNDNFFVMQGNQFLLTLDTRIWVPAQGRKIIAEFTESNNVAARVSVYFVVSAIPRDRV